MLMFVLSGSTPARAPRDGRLHALSERTRGNDKRLVSGGGMMHRFLGSAAFLAGQPFIPLKSGKNPSCFLSFDLALDFVLATLLGCSRITKPKMAASVCYTWERSVQT